MRAPTGEAGLGTHKGRPYGGAGLGTHKGRPYGGGGRVEGNFDGPW